MVSALFSITWKKPKKEELPLKSFILKSTCFCLHLQELFLQVTLLAIMYDVVLTGSRSHRRPAGSAEGHVFEPYVTNTRGIKETEAKVLPLKLRLK